MTDPTTMADPVPMLALTRAQTAKAIGCGIRSVDVLIAGRSGNGFPVAFIGRKPVVPIDALRTWLAQQVKP